MKYRIKSRAVCRLLTVGIGVGVFAHSDDAFAELSEIDVFEQAVAAGSAEGVLDFVKAFPSSHLVIDLFELLPPDLAAGVCADLPGDVSSAARRACDSLQEAVASAPAAGRSVAGGWADGGSVAGGPVAGGSTAGGSTAEGSTVQVGTAGPTARTVDAESKGSGDKQQFLMVGPTNDTSTDASISARRDGIAADDTADDAAGSSTGSAADDTTDTTDTADVDDTADSVADTTGTIPGSLHEDGGAVSATGGGKGTDAGTGGSTGGGAENGGRR